MANYAMISVASINSHENNPRTQIGDISELVQSIKANGILQHLTVIPDGDMFKCIIGHRRLAAAKKAGLTEVPCIVEELDEKQQIATMMMENMHRSNLTAREEALGFQMMFDLGESADEVSKRTGFSKTTIGHRTKMLKLDAEKMKSAEERGATISDYIKLEKIRDIAVRNKILDTIGTNNFTASLNHALSEQEASDKLNKIEKDVAKFAKKIELFGMVGDEKTDMYRVDTYYSWDKKEVSAPEDDGVYYYIVSGSGVGVYKKGEAPVYVEPEEVRAKREALDKADNSVRKIESDCRQLRIDFAEKIALKKYAEEIRAFYMDMSCAMMNVRCYNEADWNTYYEAYKENPEKAMLDAAMMCSHILNTRTYDGTWVSGERKYKFKTNELLERIYGHLESMGYVCSDMENFYRAGDFADIIGLPENFIFKEEVKNGEENV